MLVGRADLGRLQTSRGICQADDRVAGGRARPDIGTCWPALAGADAGPVRGRQRRRRLISSIFLTPVTVGLAEMTSFVADSRTPADQMLNNEQSSRRSPAIRGLALTGTEGTQYQ